MSGYGAGKQLFNRKTIKWYRDGIAVNTNHAAILSNWAEMIRTGRILTPKETALPGDFKSKIVEGGLGDSGATKGSDYTVSVEQSILQGSADLALGRFGRQVADTIAPCE